MTYANFETLVGKVSPTLHKITHRLNGRFTFFNEDDLYQEALIHLWQSFTRGEVNDKTDSYILQGCYFHLKNHIRTVVDKVSLVSMDELIDNDDLTLEGLLSDDSNNPREDTRHRLSQERIESNLNFKEKLVLDMSCDGLTVREIGKRLNVSHVMVVKIRAGLKRKIEPFKGEIGYQN